MVIWCHLIWIWMYFPRTHKVNGEKEILVTVIGIKIILDPEGVNIYFIMSLTAYQLNTDKTSRA